MKDEEILKRNVDITITEKRTNGKQSRYRISELESPLMLQSGMQVDFNEIWWAWKQRFAFACCLKYSAVTRAPKADYLRSAVTSIIQIVHKQERLTVTGVARKHIVKAVPASTNQCQGLCRPLAASDNCVAVMIANQVSAAETTFLRRCRTNAMWRFPRSD